MCACNKYAKYIIITHSSALIQSWKEANFNLMAQEMECQSQFTNVIWNIIYIYMYNCASVRDIF